jgi:hypothetical protein
MILALDLNCFVFHCNAFVWFLLWLLLGQFQLLLWWIVILNNNGSGILIVGGQPELIISSTKLVKLLVVSSTIVTYLSVSDVAANIVGTFGRIFSSATDDQIQLMFRNANHGPDF